MRNKLPWVNQFKHLGSTITNQKNIMEQDIVIKKAMYVNKNIELDQEFYFCHPKTKFRINDVYNSHYTGSPLWDLFGKMSLQFESSYNRAVKLMFDLPLATHRHLIEPISGQRHLKIILISRFMGFLGQIRSSKKIIPKMLLNTIKEDTRSITGSNLRKIMLSSNENSVNFLTKSGAEKISYHPTTDDEKWKEMIVKEIIEVKNEQLEVSGFSSEELDDILEHICVR